jgi:hypothetical protein
MRPSLLIAAALLCACGPTGPHTAPGVGACDQLRECLCAPERTSDPDTCNATVDSIEAGSTDADRTCGALLQFGCGRPLQVDPPTL